MDASGLQSYWALIAAAAIALVVLGFAGAYLLGRSARGQLRRARKELARERERQRKAAAVLQKAERQRMRLVQQAERVKPRLVREAGEAVEDAKALAKIAGDRVMVAENHLRRVILEEFAPARHDELRNRYLPDTRSDKKPFTF